MRTGTDVLPLSSPSRAPKGLLNDLAPIWISSEHDGEQILITPAVTRGPTDNGATKALMSAGLPSNLISPESLKPQNESNISPLALTVGAALTASMMGDRAPQSEALKASGRQVRPL